MDVAQGEADILRAVGGALSNWSMVELQLSTLFAHISDMPHAKARAVFDGIISFEVRVGMCDRLMALEDTDDIEAEMWNRLSARLSKFYKKRHEVAHFSMRHWDDGALTISPFPTFERIISANATQLTTAQIRERSQKFLELHMAIDWFHHRAFRRRGKNTPPFALPPLKETPLISQLRDSATRILEERKQQQPTPKDE